MKKIRVAEDSSTSSEEDRLSILPDGLLIHILSFLNTKYAVQTTALSKRWINLWTSTSSLNIDSTLFRNFSSFIKFVDQVLILHDNSVKVNNLDLSCTRAFDRHISLHEHEYRLIPFERVINYAHLHGVQDVNIVIKKYGSSSVGEFLYPCTSLRRLSLRNIGFIEYFERTLCFEQLVTLLLERVWLTDSKPFSGCPNLEDLTLLDCLSRSTGRTLSISAPKLSRLTISSMSSYHRINNIVLSTQKLKIFNYYGCLPPLLFFNDLPILDTVIIDLEPNRAMKVAKHTLNLINMLKCLHNTESLMLSLRTVELLSVVSHKMVLEASTVRNLKSLSFMRLKGRCSFNILAYVMTYLLKGTPNPEISMGFPGTSMGSTNNGFDF